MRVYSGHAPGHVRDTFLAAIEEFDQWNGEGPEPTVEFEVNYEPRPITLSQACGLVWNCTDIVPGDYRDMICDNFDTRVRGTYAGCARVMRAWLNNR